MRLNWKRSAVLAAVTASFAVGGFFIGYGHVQVEDDIRIVQPDLNKLPKNLLLTTAIDNAKRIELSDKQLTTLKKLEAPYLARYRERAKQYWQREVKRVERVMAGELLPLLDESDPHLFLLARGNGNQSPVWMLSAADPAYEQPLYKTIRQILTKKQIDQLYWIAGGEHQKLQRQLYDVAVAKSTLERLSLTTRQQKQFTTLASRVDQLLTPEGQERLKGRWNTEYIKPLAFGLLMSLLDPVQQLNLLTIVRDGVFVNR